MRTNTQTKRELDKIDRNILRILQADGRISLYRAGGKGRALDHALYRAGAAPGARRDHHGLQRPAQSAAPEG